MNTIDSEVSATLRICLETCLNMSVDLTVNWKILETKCTACFSESIL